MRIRLNRLVIEDRLYSTFVGDNLLSWRSNKANMIARSSSIVEPEYKTMLKMFVNSSGYGS